MVPCFCFFVAFIIISYFVNLVYHVFIHIEEFLTTASFRRSCYTFLENTNENIQYPIFRKRQKRFVMTNYFFSLCLWLYIVLPSFFFLFCFITSKTYESEFITIFPYRRKMLYTAVRDVIFTTMYFSA